MTQGSEQSGEKESPDGQRAQIEKARSTGTTDLETVVESLRAKLAESKKALNALSAQAAEGEQAKAELIAQLTEKERKISSLSAQLAQSELELERITGTLGWRLLRSYGQIKYRYLLPVYRLLGSATLRRRARTKTLVEHSSSIDKSARNSQPQFAVGGAVGAGVAQTPVEIQPLVSDSNTYDIVCFPIIEWDFRFQRPQQLMLRFASEGHRVFYVSQTFGTSGEPFALSEKCHNVFEVSLCGPERNVYSEVLTDRVRDVLFASIDVLRRKLSLGATVAFAQLPFWWPLVEKTRAEFRWPIVYDCMDYHAGFSTNRRQMIRQEGALLKSADLVVASSAFLENEAKIHNSNVILVRNGCDYEHFSKAIWSNGERPAIGYYGAIEDWFDSDLVADLAGRRPDWDFILVGSKLFANTKRLSKLPNVSMPGEKHYSVIPDWLGRFDVAILPFKRMSLTEATNPVKAYEILAAGKPLVSVPIPEMASLVPLVRLASTVDEFEKEISEALAEEPGELKEKRQAFARLHTWEERFEILSSAVGLTSSKASIQD
ncbi:MAG: glycosyltransferase [Acidobacteriota bacterium]